MSDQGEIYSEEGLRWSSALGAVLSRTNCDLHRKRELRHVKIEIFGPVFTPRKFSSYEEVMKRATT
jgi:hypothetical protein